MARVELWLQIGKPVHRRPAQLPWNAQGLLIPMNVSSWLRARISRAPTGGSISRSGLHATWSAKASR